MIGRHVVLFSTLLGLAACGDGVSPDNVRTVDVAASSTVLRVGESLQLTATARDASGGVVTGGTVMWRTSSATIATVSMTGLVAGHATGPVTITAEVSGVTGALELTVATAGAAIVSMPGFSFVPFTTTISRGGTVTFDFPSEPHNVIFARLTGAPTDIQATTNRSVSRTFPTAGTFPYDCTLHPGMSGVVVVQ